MRKINEIIIHCTATPYLMDVSARDIDRWHKEKGWQCIGYHYVIKLDGTIELGRNLDMEGAHCEGHNKNSIGIVYVGGLDSKGKPADTRTMQQKAALSRIIVQLEKVYGALEVHGHNYYNKNKSCPCFDVEKYYR